MVEQIPASSTLPPKALDAIFHALADSTRRTILREVTRREMSVGELAAPHRMSLAAVSKHLDVLERAKLIERERRGNCRMVRLRAERLQAAQQWLHFYEHFWTARLDALKAHLESGETAQTHSKEKQQKRR